MIQFVKGGNKGSILQDGKSFIAVTASASKTYSSERSARAFMAKAGYIEVSKAITPEIRTLAIEAIIEQLGANTDPKNVVAFPSRTVPINDIKGKRGNRIPTEPEFMELIIPLLTSDEFDRFAAAIDDEAAFHAELLQVLFRIAFSK